MSHRHEDPGADQAGRDADWVAGLLDTEAERYSPDSRRIRTAMHEQMRGSRHRASPRIRPSRIRAGIATATLVAVAVAVVATVETRPPSPGSSPAAATSKAPPASRTAVAGSSAPAAGRSTQGTAGDHAVPASVAPTPPPSSAPPTAAARAKLVSASGHSDLGSFPYWLQEEVWVSLREPVTQFQLTVTVARTPGVASTGYWTTYNTPSMFGVAVTSQASTVTYTFTLKPGHTLPAGNSTFAAQFNHWTVHNPAADTYALSVVSDEQNATVRGQAVGGF
jgi:hypothetical protein